MAEVNRLDWHIPPFRADRFLDLWEPAAAKMPAYGAKSWSLTRSIDDPLKFQQTSICSSWKASVGSPSRSWRITQAAIVAGSSPGSTSNFATALVSTAIFPS